MCGIFGVIGSYDKQKIEASLQKMLARGPDGSKIVEFTDGCFAQNRLAIIAPSHEYDPPFIDNNTFFVFNGELYNYSYIQKLLHISKCNSDSLTAFLGIKKDIHAFLQEAIGMFAFAIYDQSAKTLILARDRFGKKPLYYTLKNSTFVFSSSLDAMKTHTPTIFRKESLKSYLSFHAPIAPETIYEDIYKLPAGHTLIYKNGKIEISKYFNIFNSIPSTDSPNKLLHNSVSNRLISNVEVGAFLSGGIDSSTICAIASKELKLSGKQLKTFCIGYSGFERDDERRFAKLTAQKIGSDHYEIEFDKNTFFDSLSRVINALDEPISDPASVPLEAMSFYAASKGLKCVLSGEGGDEAFLGYDKYRLFSQMLNIKSLPFSSYLGGFIQRHKEQNREWEWYRRILNDEVAYRGVSEGFTDEQKISILNSKVSPQNSIFLLEKFYAEYKKTTLDYSSWMSYIDIYIWLSEVLLQKADKIGMSNSLEIRCPLMDHTLMTKMVHLGDARFDTKTKWIIKDIAKDLVPTAILDRSKKGFSYPFNRWVFEDGDPELVFRLNTQTQFFKKNYLDFIFKKAKNGSFKHQFWSIYLFSRWFDSRFNII